jgi:hypothetical protein
MINENFYASTSKVAKLKKLIFAKMTIFPSKFFSVLPAHRLDFCWPKTVWLVVS